MTKQGEILGRFAECKALANSRGHAPFSLEDEAAHNSLIARQKARDEARRSGYSPQAPLPLDEAA
jgi:hypothetical protein